MLGLFCYHITKVVLTNKDQWYHFRVMSIRCYTTLSLSHLYLVITKVKLTNKGSFLPKGEKKS